MQLLVTVVVSAVAAILLLWLVLFALFAVLRPNDVTLRAAARILPDAVRLVHRLARDRTLSRTVRVRLMLLLAYLAIPIDLIPDFIPVIGYADDAIIMAIVLRSVIRRAGPDVVKQHWPGTEDGLHALTRLCRLPSL